MDYKGRNIVVTGGASGIGDALLRGFAAGRGRANLYSLDVQDPRNPVHPVQYKHVDVSSSEQVEICLASIGNINYLIHGAGVRADETPQGLEKMIAANMSGTYNVFNFGVRHMKPGSTLVHIASESMLRPEDRAKSYTQTKAFGYIIGKNIATSVPRVRYKAAFPGPVDTPLFREGKTEEQVKRIHPVSPEYAAERIRELIESEHQALLCSNQNGIWVYELGDLPL